MNQYILEKSVVALVRNYGLASYPSDPPFDPDQAYPEIIRDAMKIDTKNFIYGMVRDLFHQLGYDMGNFGSDKWNPLGRLIKPGDNVVIKPNFAKHEHHLGTEGILSTITHGSVLRPVIDYVYLALRGKGKITVCDTPFEYADFEAMGSITGVKDTVNALRERGYPVELVDLRKYITKFYYGNKTSQIEQHGDPLGYVVVDLKGKSEFHELDAISQNYHTLADHTVNHYDPFCKDFGEPSKHHNAQKHEYLVSRTILNADVIISVPKLKTHGKSGVTLNLKNMIGIVSGKRYMPHHRPGNAPTGDAFPSPPPQKFVAHRQTRKTIAESVYWLQHVIGEKAMKRLADFSRKHILETFWPVQSQKKHIEWGDWYGNDTLWRTILDLNKILFYCDKAGNLQNTRQRKYLSVIDGIIGQEGQGPTMGTPRPASLLLGGEDPVAVDTVAASIMGFNCSLLRVISQTSCMEHYLGTNNMDKIRIRSNVETLPRLNFKPPNGWEILASDKINEL